MYKLQEVIFIALTEAQLMRNGKKIRQKRLLEARIWIPPYTGIKNLNYVFWSQK
jgi:hypothetical protein